MTEETYASKKLFPNKLVHVTRLCPRCKGTKEIEKVYGHYSTSACTLCQQRGYLGSDHDTHIPSSAAYDLMKSNVKSGYTNGPVYDMTYIAEYIEAKNKQYKKKRKRNEAEEDENDDHGTEETPIVVNDEKEHADDDNKEDEDRPSWLRRPISRSDPYNNVKFQRQRKNKQSRFHSSSPKTDQKIEIKEEEEVQILDASIRHTKTKSDRKKSVSRSKSRSKERSKSPLREQEESLYNGLNTNESFKEVKKKECFSEEMQKTWFGKLFMNHHNIYQPPSVVRIIGFTPDKIRVETLPVVTTGPPFKKESQIDEGYLAFHPIVAPLNTQINISISLAGKETSLVNVIMKEEASESDQVTKPWNNCPFILDLDHKEYSYISSTKKIFRWIEY